MALDGSFKTVCRMCHGGCGAQVEVQAGTVVAITGDKTNPNNFGFLCAKGRAAIEHLYHADRLRHPLRRVGPRGSGRFERISWDECYDALAAELEKGRRSFGAESVVFAQGTDRNYQEWLFRFANAFGSPNVLGPAHVCFYPRVMAGILSMGAFTFCDYEGTPDYVIVWGSNKAVTHGDGVIGTRLLAALKRGTRLIVVDPRRTSLANRADYWLQVKPGTDVALALGILNVIIGAGQYDTEFVTRYTAGFQELAQHVRPYTPEAVEDLTSVPGDLMREVALAYARAPSAAIELGIGTQQNRNSFDAARAIVILSAICGNIDRPGGDVIWEPSGIVGRRTFPAPEALPPDQHQKRLGSGRHRILSMSGWAHPGSVWTAILEEKPYPVKAMLVLGSNLLVNYADSRRVHRALEALDFLAVSDLFLTPTAAMADLVLPASGWLERDQVVEHGHYVAARRKLAQIGASKSDEEILNELARRLGMGDRFWTSSEEALDFKMTPIGWKWKDLVERSYLANRLEYFKHREHGFRTRSRKFDLYSETLRGLGYEPLPTFHPITVRASEPQSYLLTSYHSPFYFNSEFRNLDSLRRKEPDPKIELHPEAARREGISEGDWVVVSAHGGSILLRAKVTDRIAPDVVCVSANWWYPERPFDENWMRSNVNLLTTNDDENEEMGSSNFRGIRCHIRRAEAHESTVDA